MRKDEQPPMMPDGHITKGDALHTALLKVFPEWSSTRISRWLGVNPRTVQRWLSAGRGEFVDDAVPDDVSAKILSAASRIEDIELGEQLDRWISMQLKDNRVHPEVLAAWLAHRYKKLAGRDID